MKTLLLLLTLSAAGDMQQAMRCREKKHRCEMRCNEDTKGATMARIKCYDRCNENERFCNKYGSDDP
jgi:hypothetical protein